MKILIWAKTELDQVSLPFLIADKFYEGLIKVNRKAMNRELEQSKDKSHSQNQNRK